MHIHDIVQVIHNGSSELFFIFLKQIIKIMNITVGTTNCKVTGDRILLTLRFF